MSDRLLVGTRKGLFRIERRGAGKWRIADSWFLGDAVPMVLAQPERKKLHAALDLGHFGAKMRRSDDDGKSWEESGKPTYPARPEGVVDQDPVRKKDIPYDTKLVWSLEAGEADELWCGTIPGGLFFSRDGGDSWALNEALWNDPRRREWMGGGYDFAGIHTILVDPRDSAHVILGISVGGVWETRDRGKSWILIGDGQRSDYSPPETAYSALHQDPHRIAQCAAHLDRLWIQHHNGIFRSDDGGKNFVEIEDVKPSAFGFAVAVHPAEPDTAWFVPAVKDETRIPVDARLVVNRTRDGGRSFESLSDGLPDEPAYDLVYRHALDVSRDGSRLAFGSTTGSLWVSEDEGDRWAKVSGHLPPVLCVRFE